LNQELRGFHKFGNSLASRKVALFEYQSNIVRLSSGKITKQNISDGDALSLSGSFFRGVQPLTVN